MACAGYEWCAVLEDDEELIGVAEMKAGVPS